MLRLTTDIILSAIFLLEKMPTKNKNIILAINQLKTYFYDHETDLSKIQITLTRLLEASHILPEQKKQLLLLFNRPLPKVTDEEVFLNPLRRQVESLFAIKALLNPTDLMMEMVGVISKRITDILLNYNALKNTEKAAVNTFLSSLRHYVGNSKYNKVIAFGSFKERPSREQVIEILNNNASNQLTVIMHIHFKFALYAVRHVGVKFQDGDTLSGKFAEVISGEYGSIDKYLKALAQVAKHNENIRCFLSDSLICQSEIYTQFRKRGRAGKLKYSFYTEKMGLLRAGQEEFEQQFPENYLAWVADAKAQEPDYESPIVKSALKYEAIYVGGASGMAALFLHLMENLGRFKTLNQKQCF